MAVTTLFAHFSVKNSVLGTRLDTYTCRRVYRVSIRPINGPVRPFYGPSVRRPSVKVREIEREKGSCGRDDVNVKCRMCEREPRQGQ